MKNNIIHHVIYDTDEEKWFYDCNRAVKVTVGKSDHWTHKEVTCKNCLRR